MDNIILTLLYLPRIGKKTALYLIENMIDSPKDEKDLLEIFIESKINNKRIVIPTLDFIKQANEKSQLLILNSNKQNIKYIDILDEKFPKKLMHIEDAPVTLFYKGNYNCLIEENSVAIIGSRKSSQEGLNAAYKLGYNFANENYCVVSGLAIGCDEQAHKGCLKANGKTIAVLPLGLDNIYPSSNQILGEQIIENNGCLLSEYPIGTKSFKNNFIERDRIQSGLSSAIIVCETELTGGTMHTIKFAKNQRKILSCVDINVSGNQKIIKDENCIILRQEQDLEKLKKEIKIFSENKDFKKEKINSKQLKINY